MSVMQSSQLCSLSFVDSFQSSLFQGVPLPLLRYNYSSSFGSRKYCSTQKFKWSCSINEQDLPRKSRFFLRNDKNQVPSSRTSLSQSNSSFSGNSSDTLVSKPKRAAWLDKWKETSQRLPRKPPRQVLNYRSTENVINLFDLSVDSSRTRGGGSTMDKIVEKLKKFGYMDNANENDADRGRLIEKGSVEDIFYVDEGTLPNTRGGFSEDSLLGLEQIFDGKNEVRFPWEQPAAKVEEAKNSIKRRSKTYMAELTLPESELRRLKHLTLKTKQKVKIGGSGVTQTVVEKIHQKWKSSEIVRLKVEGGPALNMKRIHEILEVHISLFWSLLLLWKYCFVLTLEFCRSG